jgi:ATP phosphoribosyltransferase regulatory subunit
MNDQYLEYMLYDSDADPAGLPEGVLFLNEKETERMEKLSSSMMDLFRKSGYQTVTPPVFEHYETFEKGGGPEIARRSFSFKDREGKLLSLRYDMTTPIARMTAMKFGKEHMPLRFSYCGDVFREQPLHKGKLRQIRQAGIEHIGEDDVKTDVRIIGLLAESLKTLGALSGNGKAGHTVVLGDIQLYKHVLSKMKLSDSVREAIHSTFDRKDRISLGSLVKEIPTEQKYRDMLMELPALNGSVADVQARIKKLDPEFVPLTQRLMDIASSLGKDDRERVVIDLGLIKDFSYYSSLTLEGYLDGVGYPVANGGRYDRLFAAFGKDHPASGFAVDLSYCI